jgi:prepilin-type N-terminal cleavage/methylation domain-containing protein
MKTEPSDRCRGQGGFSLVEMLIVVAIVMIMAAVALPNIGQYIRTYKIRGASQELKGDLQSGRSKAIMSNTNAGVSFVVVDGDSYRLVQEDLPTSPVNEQLGPLKDLPTGVEFEPTTAANSGNSLRFNRLGGYCNPADTASSCATAVTPVCVGAEVTTRCSYNSGLAYVEPLTAPAGSLVVTLWERDTDLRTSVRLAPGGRVFQNPGWEAP